MATTSQKVVASGAAAVEQNFPTVAMKRKQELTCDCEEKAPTNEPGSSSPNRSIEMMGEEQDQESSSSAERCADDMEEDYLDDSTISSKMEDADEQSAMQNQVELPWEEKVYEVLNIVRRQKFAEYDPKQDGIVYTRFCRNIAFFDLDRESNIGPGPPIHSIPSSDYLWLMDSVNVIAIKVAESDLSYPIRIYGTILARDQQDYRCVYLFRRDKEHPQHIASPEDMITLTGPYRALGSTDIIIFEINLKVLGEGNATKDFSKGVIEHRCVHHTKKLMKFKLTSWLSTVELIYTPVQFAVQAFIAVNVLEGLSDFSGKVIAWTTKNEENEIVLHDSQVSGFSNKLRNNGSVELTRHIVAVPLDGELVINVILFDGDHEDECFEFVLGLYDEESTCKQSCYELQVKVAWTGILGQEETEIWKRIGEHVFLGDWD
uniref:DUF6598 domain-containing protein n=1 Tax=Oryza brachyantha TaxID=4533 RepID=J3MQ55_ORYBR